MRKTLFVCVAVLVIGSTFVSSSATPLTTFSSLPSEPEPSEVKAKVRAAFEEFKSLSKKEKKSKFKAAKKAIKDFKADRKAGKEVSTNTLLLVILALFVPPLAVYLHQGTTNNKFWITLLLFVLGLLGVFFLGWYLILASIIYALIVILGG
jgi:uncharacterized membrane protein YqaE (UPF0057 family)